MKTNIQKLHSSNIVSKTLKTIVVIAIIAVLGSCSKDDEPAPAPPTNTNPVSSGPTTIIEEGFDSFAALGTKGWEILNKSNPVGTKNWFVGISAYLLAQSGENPNSYIACNFENTGSAGTINSWLITPNIKLKNGDVVTFWSSTTDSPAYDRLELRLSGLGELTNNPSNETSFGSFSNLLIAINPMLVPNVYPLIWTKYTATIAGLNGEVNCKLGFRYFITNAGANANQNANYIGVDTFKITRP
jgi:hypothetical protein